MPPDSKFIWSRPRTMLPGPIFLERSVPPEDSYKTHFILHPGFIHSDPRKGLLSFEDMREQYGLTHEPYVSRYGVDIMDELGSLHLYPPLEDEDPLVVRAQRETEHRKSRAFKKLLSQGTLYRGSRYPSKKPGFEMPES